jgi:hypothetical protein
MDSDHCAQAQPLLAKPWWSVGTSWIVMGECITKPKIKSFLLYVSSSIENTSGLQNELSILYVDNKPCPANSPNSGDCPSLFFFFFLGGLRYCPSIWKRRSLWQLAFFRPAGAELTVHIYTCCRLFRVGNRMSATGACSACPSDSCKLWSDEIWIWMNMMHDAGVYL